jgi:tryptophan-rich sensory protein
MTRWRPIAIAAASAIFVSVLGGLMTDLGPWYANLKQPPWKPPDWAFGPIWTTIFALAAAAGVIGWRRAPTRADRERLLVLFAANGFLNVFWSLLYFRLHRPDWSLLEVPLLWLSVLALIVVLARYARSAAWLLAPYLVWVAIAALLNWQTVKLNGPFGPT